MTELHQAAPTVPNLSRPRAAVTMARNRRVLTNGIGAAGREPSQAAACRQDPPSKERLLAALSTVRSA